MKKSVPAAMSNSDCRLIVEYLFLNTPIVVRKEMKFFRAVNINRNSNNNNNSNSNNVCAQPVANNYQFCS